ncbi:MAG: YwaF family protein [Clostridia bacterium]|nr:YwaF family protein [Clostridia bacterium]
MTNFFWLHKKYYIAASAKGFSCFSLPHLVWLAVLLIGIALLTRFYIKLKSEQRNNLRKSLALFLILSEIAKQCFVGLTGDTVSNHLPLHICSFAEYTILIDALWPDNRFSKSLLCYAFLPSAFMALIFPNATAYPPLSFYTIHHFILHACIVAYIIARYSAGEIRICYKGVWSTFLAIGALSIPIYFIDKAFDVNFIFLMNHSNNPALMFIWNISGGTGGISYIIGLGVLVLITIHLTFGIFVAIEALEKRFLKNKVNAS